MYRSRLWTMRQFAGFGTAGDTNGRFKELLRAGGDGLSTAFDMPTLLGRDSDDPLARGEVGRAGVAVDTLADMETLFDGIDLGAVSTSMTINSPAGADPGHVRRGGRPHRRGTGRRCRARIQNDILKEYQAQKEYVFPPRPSVRLVTDMIRFSSAELPRWHPVSVSGYHIREAGSTAAQELAFTLANGFAYVEAAIAAGVAGGRVRAAPQLLLQRAHRLLRGDRQVPRRPADLGPLDARPLRSHRRTVRCSCGSTPRPPASPSPPSSPRSTSSAWRSKAWRACSAGPRACTPTPSTRRLALPTEHAARLALRTQQVIAEESGVVHVADPLGGSWFVEELTDELERQAEDVFAHLLEAGSGSVLEGVVRLHRRRLVRLGDRRRRLRLPVQVGPGRVEAWSA